MDLGGLETLSLAALGGADAVTVGSLAGTGVATTALDLGVSNAGDASVDSVIVNGTAARTSSRPRP